MTALGEEIVFAATMARSFADQFFASFITFAGIDNIEPGIQRTVQQTFDGFFRRAFKANLGPAETKNANLHVCLAELPLFHLLIVGRFCETPRFTKGALADQLRYARSTLDPADLFRS